MMGWITAVLASGPARKAPDAGQSRDWRRPSVRRFADLFTRSLRVRRPSAYPPYAPSGDSSLQKLKELNMADIVYLALGIGAFVTFAVAVRAAERM